MSIKTRKVREKHKSEKNELVEQVLKRNRKVIDEGLIRDADKYGEAVVVLDENILKHFDVRKKRCDVSSLI
jgi:hypothetical protein